MDLRIRSEACITGLVPGAGKYLAEYDYVCNVL